MSVVSGVARARRLLTRRRRAPGRPRRQQAATGPDVRELEQRLADLEDGTVLERLRRLEDEVQELRALGIRVAEVADLVTELLAMAAKRDDPEFARIVASYVDTV